MTSGQFTSFPVDQIYVNRDERQRKELKNIEQLADSIKRIGLINPIVIERTGELRAGERRWTAIKSLGWTHVSVQFVDELSPAEFQILELEENIRREQLEWPDECRAVAKYHSLMLADNQSWTLDQTAEALGMSRNSVGDKLGVARELEAGNQRVIDAPKMSVARNIVARTRERAQSSAITALATGAFPPSGTPIALPTAPLVHMDFHEWARTYKGWGFNLIHCDFPYGIGADTHDQGASKSHGGYADSPEVYKALLDTLGLCMNNGVISDSAHLMFWFSMDTYKFTFDRLTDMGWKVNEFPLIWYKSDNIGILSDPNRGPRRVYETAFFASRGDRRITPSGAVANVCAWPGRSKPIHMSEKPVQMLRHFMRMMVDEYSRVLDPTAGSGNALKAAQELDAGYVIGLEANEEFYQRAVDMYFSPEE